MKPDVANKIMSEVCKECLFAKTDLNVVLYREKESKYWKFFDEFTKILAKVAYKNFSLHLKTSEARELIDMLKNAFESGVFSYDTAKVASGRRVVQRKGSLYIDAGNKTIKISKNGVKEIQSPADVAFLKSPTQKPMSDLAAEGDINKLKEILCLNEQQWDRLLLFLINAMRPNPPRYMLVLSGPPGSGKTTMAWILKQLLDPEAGEVAGMPNKLADLKLMASQSRVLVLDNMGQVSPKVADALCVMCSGGSNRTRTLYTTSDMTIMEYNSILILTSVGRITERADIQERSINIDCNFIKRKKSTDQLMNEFNEYRASIERGLYDIVHAILGNEDYVPVQTKCRMPDVVNWAGRAESYLGLEHGFFSKVAEMCQDELQSMIASESPLVDLIKKVMVRLSLNSEDPAEFKLERSSPDMLNLLLDSAPKSLLRDKEMPRSVAAFGRVVSELESVLKKLGIAVQRYNSTKKGGRTIEFSWTEKSKKRIMKELEAEAENRKASRKALDQIAESDDEETIKF